MGGIEAFFYSFRRKIGVSLRKFRTRVGRLLAFVRDPPPPPVEMGRRPPGGGGGGGALEGGFREGRWGGVGRVGWGGGVQVGRFGVVGGGGTGSRYLPLPSL